MLKNIEELQQNELSTADVCIIGAGPAGIDIARSFLGTDIKVTLLEGGYLEFDQDNQDLSRFIATGRPIKPPRLPNKEIERGSEAGTPGIRQYGGSYKRWDATWRSVDPVDFHEKPYYPMPPWPIELQEVTRHYKSVANDYFVKALLSYKRYLLDTKTGLVTDLSSLRPIAEYRLLPRIPYENFTAKTILKSSNIDLITGANAVSLELTENGKHISSVLVRSRSKKEWYFKARYFILCCGAIENARLLLSSNGHSTKGIGNDHDLVGRNLICSPKGVAGVVAPFVSRFNFPQPTRRGDKHFRVGIALNSKLLEKMKLPNHCFFIELPPPGKKIKGEVAMRFLEVNLEQLPNRDSRVTLSDQHNSIGMNIPNVEWKLSEQDQNGFEKTVQLMTKIFWEHKVGRILVPEQNYSLNFLRDNGFFMGTTRMGASPSEGVVDTNCKVFGIDNLYINGTSVFPVSGNINPMFTLLCLSKRLANHIKTILK